MGCQSSQSLSSALCQAGVGYGDPQAGTAAGRHGPPPPADHELPVHCAAEPFSAQPAAADTWALTAHRSTSFPPSCPAHFFCCISLKCSSLQQYWITYLLPAAHRLVRIPLSARSVPCTKEDAQFKCPEPEFNCWMGWDPAMTTEVGLEGHRPKKGLASQRMSRAATEHLVGDIIGYRPD